MSQPQFDRIVAQLRAGDNQPLKVLFEKYADHCVGGLQRHTGCSREDAEDAFQDAVIQFRENTLANRISHTKNLQGYLYSICFNLHRARQQQRIQQNRKIAERGYEKFEVPQIEKDITQQDQQRRTRLALAAFERLGENCRRLLTYFYLDELDNATIAQKMGLANANVVKSNKRRCMQRWSKQVRMLQERPAKVLKNQEPK
jgi:RNA polymerase sigma factor (sigma-70 family)